MVRIADPPSINDLTTTSGVLSGEGGEGGEGVRACVIQVHVHVRRSYFYIQNHFESHTCHLYTLCSYCRSLSIPLTVLMITGVAPSTSSTALLR